MDDNQDKIPLKQHEKILGHAVRANYLYAGVADLCLEEEDPDYIKVLHKVWRSLVDKKLYITGGCGALYNGASPYGYFFDHQLVHQAYGYEYQLPNITAYNETCASLGGVFWAYRMFQLEPKAEYFDILERMMLNTNLAALSLDGKRFFYENMLRRAKKLDYKLIWPLTEVNIFSATAVLQTWQEPLPSPVNMHILHLITAYGLVCTVQVKLR
ncbi:MAG: beta-L-arabinofuranosidase domain-containing protein [Blautia faecis]